MSREIRLIKFFIKLVHKWMNPPPRYNEGFLCFCGSTMLTLCSLCDIYHPDSSQVPRILKNRKSDSSISGSSHDLPRNKHPRAKPTPVGR